MPPVRAMNRWMDLVEHPTAAAALAKASPSETRRWISTWSPWLNRLPWFARRRCISPPPEPVARIIAEMLRRSLETASDSVDIFPKGNTMATMADSKARRTRRSFTDAYKTGAVRLVLDEGKTVAAAARDLGLTESSLRNWVEQARADRTKGKTGLTTEERTELAALRKDNRELRMERDILKKAAAFFARNQA